jgi:hypothetical protein
MSCSCITFQFPGIYAIYLVVHTWDIHLFKLKNTMEQQGTSKALKSFGDSVNTPSLEVL